METFPEVSSQMLHELKALLSHSPSPIGNSRMLQLVTINMFAIENAAPKGKYILYVPIMACYLMEAPHHSFSTLLTLLSAQN